MTYPWNFNIRNTTNVTSSRTGTVNKERTGPRVKLLLRENITVAIITWYDVIDNFPPFFTVIFSFTCVTDTGILSLMVFVLNMYKIYAAGR